MSWKKVSIAQILSTVRRIVAGNVSMLETLNENGENVKTGTDGALSE